MNRETLLEYIGNRYGVAPEYPWGTDPDSAVLRHAGNRKWFALIMKLEPARLKRTGEAPVDVVNLKCDPLLIGSVRMLPGVLPAYHMNKDHWITVLLEGGPDDDTLSELLDMSYALTETPRKKTAGKGKRV